MQGELLSKTDNNFYKALLDNLYDGVYLVDLERRITYWNKGAERLTGYKSSEVLGKRCADNILMHTDDEGINLCQNGCPLLGTMADACPREVEVYLHHKEGHRVPVHVRATPILGPRGQVIGAVEIFSDNSSKISTLDMIKELKEMTFLDPLTGLANRRFFEPQLQLRLDEMHRYGWSFGVLFLDIDHFKRTNDLYGHDVGDLVLKMVANTLSKSLRTFDLLGRYGGEEFVAIISNANERQLHAIANRCRVLIEKSSLTIGTSIISVTVSIGAALAQPGDTAKTLLRQADLLMYKAKTLGRNRVSLKVDDDKPKNTFSFLEKRH